MLIESLQNNRIKNILKLQEKSRERKKQGLFVVEGLQENQLALASKFRLKELYICDAVFEADLKEFPAKEIFTIAKNVFEKIAYRETTGGIIGLYEIKDTNLSQINLGEIPLVLVLEAVEKPGNLGAILRTADGAGATAVVICDPQIDFFNANVIRSSVGTIFTNQIAKGSKEQILTWLQENDIQIVSTFLREETKSLYAVDFKVSTAIVLGTEATGLSDFWADHSDVLVKIPMNGKVDSLNVSNAAAIATYEAVRQREK